MLAQDKVLEFCEKITRRKDTTQMSEVRVLALASRLQIPMRLIELNSTLRASKPRPTYPSHLSLRVRINTPVLIKEQYNAFAGTALHQDLQAANIKRVVLMGRQTNCCVKQTAIGGAGDRSQTFVPGATGHGYKVMTNLQIIAEGRPNWADSPDVEFYAQL
jgi:hypothetical protein